MGRLKDGPQGAKQLISSVLISVYDTHLSRPTVDLVAFETGVKP